MAGNFSISDLSTNIFSATPMFEIVCPSGMSPKLTEMGVSVNSLVTNQVTTIGIGVPQASGVTPRRVRYPVAEDLETSPFGPCGFLQFVSDWDKPPTAPLQFKRRFSLLGSSGSAGYFWFPLDGLKVLQGTTMVVWCITAAVAGNFASVHMSLEA